ncbi:MAG: NlpC/P60 family protein, partial [Nakamurella sp.]
MPAAPPAGTAPASTPVDGLPVCLPGQESAPVSGAGTPAPLGVLEGLPADVKAGGTFAGVKLDAEQVTMAATVVAVGKQMGITRRGIEIALAVATEQSSLRPEAINQDWLGLFQQNPVTYTQYRRTEPGGAAWMFYDQLIKQVPGYDSDPRQNYEIGDVVQKTTTGERFAEYQDMSADFVGRLTDAVSLHQDDVTCTPAPAAQAATGSNFDPGNIISDQVFYNTTAMTVDQIRVFIRAEGEACVGPYCLKNLSLTTPNQPADRYCAAYQGGTNEDAATVIAKFSAACGINPQVMLVTLQKESGLLSRTDVSAATYNAAWGWHCPDTGPGGSANCDPAYAGFFNQGYGMAKQWSRYKLDPAKYNYQAGQTVNIMWNVAESGCGSAPVSIKNQATASLYIYTPYQPNAAALAAYPGTGDSCSAYGNRNFFFMFRKYFGSTGGGSSTTGAATTVSAVLATGTAVKIPNNQYVSAALAGQTITAPNAAVAAGLAAGFSALGLPYVWGGGGSGAGPNNGCARGGGDYNSCGSTIGFDCSGLTAYVLGMAGYQTPGDSGSQRAAGQSISWAEAVPGDIVGFPGHVAIYLGTFGGRPYILEASWVGTPIHIVPLTRTDVDDRVHRYWAGPAVAAPRVADFSSIVSSFGSTGSYTLSGGSPSAGSGNRAGGSTGYVSRIPQIRPLAYPAPVVLPVPQPVPVAPVPPPEAPLPVAPTLVAPPPVSPPPPVDPPVTQPAPPVTEPVTEPTVAEPPVTETSTSTTEVTVERVAPSSTTAPTASSLSAQSPTESTGSSTADRRSPASAIPTPTATTTTVGSTPGSSTAAGSSSALSTGTTANKPRPAATTAPGSGRPTTTGATTTASPPVSS